MALVQVPHDCSEAMGYIKELVGKFNRTLCLKYAQEFAPNEFLV
jgi:hypothetical protein